MDTSVKAAATSKKYCSLRRKARSVSASVGVRHDWEFEIFSVEVGEREVERFNKELSGLLLLLLVKMSDRSIGTPVRSALGLLLLLEAILQFNVLLDEWLLLITGVLLLLRFLLPLLPGLLPGLVDVDRLLFLFLYFFSVRVFLFFVFVFELGEFDSSSLDDEDDKAGIGRKVADFLLPIGDDIISSLSASLSRPVDG